MVVGHVEGLASTMQFTETQQKIENGEECFIFLRTQRLFEEESVKNRNPGYHQQYFYRPSAAVVMRVDLDTAQSMKNKIFSGPSLGSGHDVQHSPKVHSWRHTI